MNFSTKAPTICFCVLLLVALLLVASCATAPSPADDQAQAFFVLESRSVVDRTPADGFYVEGIVGEGLFLANGQIQGEGTLGTDGSPGWVELPDGSFYPDQTGRAPFPPYIRGFLDAQGVFRPDSRTVHY